jgi:hypothetical protein
MNRRQLLKSAATAAGIAAVTVTPSISLAKPEDDEQDMGIEGSWFGNFNITNPPVGSLKTVFTFHKGGTFTSFSRPLVKGTPFGDLLETSGAGTWERTSGGVFRAAQRLFIQRVDTGEVFGTDHVRFALTVSRDGQTLAGTFLVQGKDLSEAIMFELRGDYSASRIIATE